MGKACVLCLNGSKVRILHFKQFLDKRFGTQKKLSDRMTNTFCRMLGM